MGATGIPAGGRPIVFGEVLFDRFPDGHAVLGGAPFNVAWHLQAFGRAPLLVSRVGDDALGRRIRDAMASWQLDPAGLQLDGAHPTGTVEVSFEGGEPRFDIVAGRAWDFVDAAALPALGGAPALYHGSLALRNPVSRSALERLRARAGAPVFLDVNLRDPWWERARVLDLVAGARWVKVNEDELARLVPDAADTDRRMSRLLEMHLLALVVVTRGAAGAIARGAGAERAEVVPARDLDVVDSVGAGDAFASVLLLGLLAGWPLAATLERAQDFASAIVGVRGAVVTEPAFYEPFIRQWGLP